jgi:GTP-binding protein EngB required for normal cell division
MSETIEFFNNQKKRTLDILMKLLEFVEQGQELGVSLHPDLIHKVQNSLSDTKGQKLRVALIGGFSEGKTSIAAAWMERLDKSTMKISHQESSNEVSVYEVGDDLQIIDTPGLFGFKEKLSADTQAIERYKDITKRYVSEAHLVLYVMNSNNSIKESHTDDLMWLFRTLKLLPRTIFVLSRFDEVADVEDSADYLEKFLIKKDAVIQRLYDVLHLSNQEKAELSIVAVAANPFDMGTEHWLSHMEQFKRLSHINTLQEATKSKIQQSGGAIALAHEVQKSIISDIMVKHLPVARQNDGMLQEESQRLEFMRKDQEYELDKILQKMNNARIRLRGRIIRYFEDIILQSKGVGIETFTDFFHREIGSDGILINQKIQEIFADEISSITLDLSRIQVKVDSELVHFNDIVVSLGKQGISYLSKSNIINNKSILMARDGLGSVAKTVGLDIDKWIRFKPWGATKLAGGLSSALSVLGLAFEAWDSWQQEERKRKFQEAIGEMRDKFSRQLNEILDLIAAPTFYDDFFPGFSRLEEELQSLHMDLEQLSRKHERFQQWHRFGESIDIEFHEIN